MRPVRRPAALSLLTVFAFAAAPAAGQGTRQVKVVLEAATQVIVPNGGRLLIGGATGSLHAVTRQVLAYRAEQASQDTALTVSATILP